MSTNEELKPNQKQDYYQPLLIKHGLLTDVTAQKSGDKGKEKENSDKNTEKGPLAEEKFDADAKMERDEMKNARDTQSKNATDKGLTESFKTQKDIADKPGIEF
ncbi:hypothetical protein GNF10_27265 [Nostoc sp. UCD121]|uniref:hypothetical protein n=1 Tax=unclassified Nostoc TaxID=2593658 RepID=UPI001626585D|nr:MULTISPECIES: hypothetical protein [unclassified Nostoc]MBC1224361.1 hypothetical protein [Nostoc sp. UCD120]MBC1279557.1 hypothetical protein [Nostoc sp. UCD121]MBC1296456.1 hypothetical protein [Nostoc sp. UCD122]